MAETKRRLLRNAPQAPPDGGALVAYDAIIEHRRPSGPRSGQHAEAYDADLIIFDGDPRAAITILANPGPRCGGMEGRPPDQGSTLYLIEHH